MEKYDLAIDVGGTFTDAILYDKTRGRIQTDKLPTTPNEPSIGFFRCMDEIVEKNETSVSNIDRMVLHATTLATNALIEKKGAKVGLIVTKGFRDILFVRRGIRYDQYDFYLDYPPPLVSRRYIWEINERVHADGSVERAAVSSEIRQVVKELLSAGSEAVAVCFLHSYLKPENERAVKLIAEQEFGAKYVSISSEVSPVLGEYERMTTTVINAYVQGIVDSYLQKIQWGLRERRFKGDLYMITNSGGRIEIELAKKYPIQILESSPTAGAVAAAYLGKKMGVTNIFSWDMGGTTSKGYLIRHSEVDKGLKFEAARLHQFKQGSGYPILIPHMRMIEIGSGGGSIASLDERGIIQVGPQSAGANPGPACYGRGGVKPTLTDANLVLGYLNPENFLGGRMKLFKEKAAQAIRKEICESSGMSVTDAAWGIHETANEMVARAFRMHMFERGVDQRDFVLLSFGGASQIHAIRVAKKLYISKAILPARAGVFACFGMLTSPLAFEYVTTHRREIQSMLPREYLNIFGQMAHDGIGKLERARVTKKEVKIVRSLDMRYRGQGFDLEVPLGPGPATREEIPTLKERFERAYKSFYGQVKIDAAIEIVNFKCTVTGPPTEIAVKAPPRELEVGQKNRKVYFDRTGYVDCRVYPRHALTPGEEITGPAIIEGPDHTLVVEPDTTVKVDHRLNVIWSSS